MEPGGGGEALIPGSFDILEFLAAEVKSGGGEERRARGRREMGLIREADLDLGKDEDFEGICSVVGVEEEQEKA